MSPNPSRSPISGRGVAAMAALALVPMSATAAIDDWARHLRVGAWIGFGLQADFTLAGSVPVSGVDPGQAGVPGLDHTYDNGFVRRDQTGNALGLTSNWGYQDAGQWVGNDLVFRASRSFAVDDLARKEGGPHAGLDVGYGTMLGSWGETRWGFEFGFGLLPVVLSDFRTLNGSIRRTVHAYDTGGLQLPQAPYSGGVTGVGPLLGDTAVALPEEVQPGEVRGARVIDAWLYNLRLGPQLYRELGGRWAVSAGAGAAMGIVVGDYRFDETVWVNGVAGANNLGAIGRTDVNAGAYANAMLLWHTNPDADFYVGVQWMTLGKTRFAEGNREGLLRMENGFQVVTGIRWPF